jgi:hypothetical protein
MTTNRTLVAVAVAAIFSCTVALAESPGMPSVAPGPEPNGIRIVAPDAQAYGGSYEEWANRFWQWMWSMPSARNPGFDLTGRDLPLGQSGRVWFLINSFYPGTTERRATIPADTALFLEIFEWFASFETDPGQPDTAGLKAILAEYADTIADLSLTVDGVPVPNLERFRIQSGPMYYTLDDMFEVFGYGTPPGVYAPGFSDGYFVMLTPLSPGEHTISWTASSEPYFPLQETIWHLTVKERPAP